jgi:hypothetical protein
MNTRLHCRTSPPIGIGGQPMPGGITTNSRTGFAASRPSAGFRIPSANCLISPGATMPEPIGSAAEPQTDDRRSARMGNVDDRGPSASHNVAARAQTLATSATRSQAFSSPKPNGVARQLPSLSGGLAFTVRSRVNSLHRARIECLDTHRPGGR